MLRAPDQARRSPSQLMKESSRLTSGHKRTLTAFFMSALPPKADIETGPVISFDAATPAASRHSPQSAAPRPVGLPLLIQIKD